MADHCYYPHDRYTPYRPYSPARPGAVEYAPTVIQPFDVNHKRVARMEAASRALKVLEAQFQNAVRLAIDDTTAKFAAPS